MLQVGAYDFSRDSYERVIPLMKTGQKGKNGFISWCNVISEKEGLYDPEYEKDSCGVGFVANIKGGMSHKIVSDARYLLCNMTHRGAVSSDGDGDGAGILIGIPHEFFKREFKLEKSIKFPERYQYAVGNIFFKEDRDGSLKDSQNIFEQVAESLGLKVLSWREVPHDSSVLGSVALSCEPVILQPLVVLWETCAEGSISNEEFSLKYVAKFRTKLYILRKQASLELGLQSGFYVCSLSNRTIVYKGQLTPSQVYDYYHDLTNTYFKSHFALVHSRFSTNTFPSWDRAQPLRWLAHNGEINTLRGNKNWMRAKEGMMASELFQDDLEKLYSIIEEGGSDSAALDNVLELLVINGVLSLPEAMCLLVPEPYHKDMNPNLKAWFDWAACLMEPWDGPALLTFTDGRYIGATLDRNGLRPCRYYITSDDRVICASEVGVIPVENELVISKGKLKPGDMLLLDTELGEIIDTKLLKDQFSTRKDFKSWLSRVIKLEDLSEKTAKYMAQSFISPTTSLKVQEDPRLLAFGYTYEQISLVLVQMSLTRKEPSGFVSNYSPLACLNEKPILVFDYFRQLFAQITTPPIDPIRESNVMSLECFVGPQGNILEINSSQCDRLFLKSPILKWDDFEALKNIHNVYPTWSCFMIDITFDKSQGLLGYTDTIERITHEASDAIEQCSKLIIISDRKIDAQRISISSLIAVGVIHNHLIKNKQRFRVALVLETGEAREVHQLCLLLGYGCDAIFPYLAMEILVRMNMEGLICDNEGKNPNLDDETLINNYRGAVNTGILRVMSEMGISTLASYKGAQIFEVLGLDDSIIDLCFAGTASRIKGVTFDYLAQDAFFMHERGFSSKSTIKFANLFETDECYRRDSGQKDSNDSTDIASSIDSFRDENEFSWEMYVRKENEAIKGCTIRGLLTIDYDFCSPIHIDQVEPWTDIAERFSTGATSYGSISMDLHSTSALNINHLCHKSNFDEDGELPAHNSSGEIANSVHSTSYLGLISSPPHHDIYSIEDLKQLIYDLKSYNPRTGFSVKLGSEVGVGIAASGVAKANADHILVSGHDGSTGAARCTSIKYAGSPWELGLAETHQTLVLNDLRKNVVVQTDAQLKTGFDIAVAILLGAESFTLATIPSVATYCIISRKCHLKSCSLDIPNEYSYLKSKFVDQPEYVIKFFYYLIEDLRNIMARLGFRTINEMVGHSEKLKKRKDVPKKTLNIDLSSVLTPGHTIRSNVSTHFTFKQDHNPDSSLDNTLIDLAKITLDKGIPVSIDTKIINTDRAIGASLSYRVFKRFGENGLPQDTILVNIEGSAGQSFGAFLIFGITFILHGDANDYVGKGLSGGRIIIRSPEGSKFKSHENVIIGDTCFYGATLGQAFIAGIVGERFAVRNSGATIVVEGIKGNNAFEYMTGGRVVILSQIESLNAFSGATGGIVYCLTSDYDAFVEEINMETIELEDLVETAEIAFVKNLIQEHFTLTKSELAGKILHDFDHYISKFVKVIPSEYKKALTKESVIS